MGHISVELAKKLKAAGLVWEPRAGDFYINSRFLNTVEIVNSGMVRATEILKDGYTWCPRLDQLLVEIERRGFRWGINNLGSFGDHDVSIGLFNWEGRTYIKGQFYTDTPEDTAAQALLWILEQGA
jgi:hypothetical protein